MSDVVLVQLIGVPLALAERTRRHQESLMREFQLIEFADNERAGDIHETSPPTRLLTLTTNLRAAYDKLGFSTREFAAPRENPDVETVDLQIPIPPNGLVAVERLRDAMDEAERWCERGDLLTLVTPPDCRAFRSWFLGEIIRQVGGEPPVAWADFVA